MRTTSLPIRCLTGALCLAAAALLVAVLQAGSTLYGPTGATEQGVVQCANLIYSRDKSSVCFSDEFLATIQKETNIRTNRRFCPVKLGSSEVFQYPFAVMTGEGAFTLPPEQRANLRSYLTRGGFLVASAGCSSNEWDASFRAEIRAMFPELSLKKVPMTHAVFHTVYDISKLPTTHGHEGALEGLEIDGRIVMVYSPEGLNDTSNAGSGCCCCGGDELRFAQRINVNLLTYALTH